MKHNKEKSRTDGPRTGMTYRMLLPSLILLPVAALTVLPAATPAVQAGGAAMDRTDADEAPPSPKEDLAARIESELQAIIRKAGPATVTVHAGGSGVLISPDGLILTNFHVAGSVPACEIGVPGGRKYFAKRVGFDRAGDLCLLKIESSDTFPYVEFGDSDRLKTGDWVIAIGNPFMTAQTTYEPTVTVGVISGLHRLNAQGGGLIYGNCIQHDAAINPGNSGGPLFDIQGRLIGINGKIDVRRGRVNSGIGYAIPIDQIKRSLPLMKQGKPVVHGWVGVDLSDASGQRGAQISKISPGAPAEAAGLKIGDLIVKIEDRPIRETVDVYNALWPYLSGETVRFQTVREGFPRAVEVKLGNPPAQPPRQPGRPGRPGAPGHPGARPAPQPLPIPPVPGEAPGEEKDDEDDGDEEGEGE